MGGVGGPGRADLGELSRDRLWGLEDESINRLIVSLAGIPGPASCRGHCCFAPRCWRPAGQLSQSLPRPRPEQQVPLPHGLCRQRSGGSREPPEIKQSQLGCPLLGEGPVSLPLAFT